MSRSSNNVAFRGNPAALAGFLAFGESATLARNLFLVTYGGIFSWRYGVYHVEWRRYGPADICGWPKELGIPSLRRRYNHPPGQDEMVRAISGGSCRKLIHDDSGVRASQVRSGKDVMQGGIGWRERATKSREHRKVRAGDKRLEKITSLDPTRL